MAGMLPGLHAETVRRRRLSPDSITERGLFASNRGTYGCSITSVQRSAIKKALEAEEESRLEKKVRESKERLDERLRNHKKSLAIRKATKINEEAKH